VSYPLGMRLGALLLVAGFCLAQGLSTAERQLNLESFEKVWTTVRDKHWDLKSTGLDWQKVHDELRPKVEAAKSTDEARDVMQEMLDRLKQTHFSIVPSDVYKDLDEVATGSASPGIDLRLLDGKAIVTAVEAGSPAALRGVKPGWEIARIEGKELDPMLKRVGERFKSSTTLDLRLTRAVLARLQGATASPVKVEFVDGTGKAVSLELDRARPRGKLVSFGNLPAQHVWAEWRKVGDVAYVAFNMFMDAELIAKTMQEAVEGCAGCKGFVVDVRGNPGGVGGIASGVAGWFVDRAGLELGKMYMKGATVNFAVFPRATPYAGPLAVLVDGCSASTAEILAGGLKDIHRARVFGTRTAGGALPSVFDKLPNGDGFQYAIANYISTGGQPLEGIGVKPDEEIRLTRRGLLDGHDAVLEAAVDWIAKSKK
jgi:carboxyl-terminal processing protease